MQSQRPNVSVAQSPASSGDALTVDTAAGQTVPVTLTDRTRYLKVAPSSLNRVDPGAYIGTATKSIGDQLIALEVVIFPPSLKGTGEGHYAWDRIPDTTLSGVGEHAKRDDERYG
jgi:hypothetical protein